MERSDEVRLDAKGLRAMAHPLRVQIVGLLRRHGPSTATRLAQRLGVNSGSASYHLRQLAEAGFVEELTDRGNARERWWRSAHRMTRFDDRELAAREPDATRAYLQSVADTYALRVRQALGEVETLPAGWRGTFDMSDWGLRLTPAEAVALRKELAAVLNRHRQEATEAAASAPSEARTVSVILQILPDLGDEDGTDVDGADGGHGEHGDGGGHGRTGGIHGGEGA
ncbi:helix-turn-helix domain-containing protein [Streptomyces sp. MJP52]|uniref:ArsR/SmtB family transcription factor n=1 Tax=Streptomyces sp. MJP52 TaxID=2940555 RepID=UPI002474E8BB|nr:helix-turn-helix domain-containing protein [Streptomyces sp. MJP52]MDH6223792.1 DNA-binding transcriptional ArsR family regulator [Streptomyces sp. MJP52]